MILEFLVAVTLAGGAMFLLQRYTSSPNGTGAVTAEGVFIVSTPLKAGTPRSFHDMTLQKTGLVLHDAAGEILLTIPFAGIRQVSPVRSDGGCITLHLEAPQGWQVLSLQMAPADMALLAGTLRQVL